MFGSYVEVLAPPFKPNTKDHHCSSHQPHDAPCHPTTCLLTNRHARLIQHIRDPSPSLRRHLGACRECLSLPHRLLPPCSGKQKGCYSEGGDWVLTWEEGWLPRLDEGLAGGSKDPWVIQLSVVGWIMRIAEENGEVNDEFPCVLFLFFLLI
jgi:hypothetical protein